MQVRDEETVATSTGGCGFPSNAPLPSANPDQAQGVPLQVLPNDPEGQVISATTRTDAAARLAELRDQILSGRGASFADLAAQHSDCSSARRGGDLGYVAVLAVVLWCRCFPLLLCWL